MIFEACTKDSLQCVTPGVYAMVGAAAALAGVTRLTGRFRGIGSRLVAFPFIVDNRSDHSILMIEHSTQGRM
jgi:hypothetical protein